MRKTAILACLGTLLSFATPAASNQENQGEAAAYADLEELEAPTIIEADNHAPVDVATYTRIQKQRQELPSDFNALSDLSRSILPPKYAAASSGISVTFNSQNPAPANAQVVIEAAAAQWGAALETNPNGPIEIEVHWESLGSTNLLGYAGPERLYQSNSLPTNAAYPVALVNTLLGIDANGASNPEIEVVLNADLVAINRWYISTGTNPGSSQIDLYSTALHEIGHGLGFSGSADLVNSTPQLGTPNFVYDTLMEVNGTALTNLSNQSSHLRSNQLNIRIGGGITHEIHSPTKWASGSSYSHFEESKYPHGSAGSLMTPVIHSGKADRKLDAAILGVLHSSGWGVNPSAITPQITSVDLSSSSATVNWKNDLTKYGLPPAQIKLEAIQNGVVRSTDTTSGANTSATVSGLKSNTTYSLKVTPIASNGTGSATTTTAKTTSSGTSTNGSNTSSTTANIRNVPLDGQISRLYQAYFLRLPDSNGFSYWQKERAEGASALVISQSFANSAEFRTRYGSLNNQQFVNLLYKNVLKRNPDSGATYWTNLLNNGTSRGELVVFFSESTENIIKTGYLP